MDIKCTNGMTAVKAAIGIAGCVAAAGAFGEILLADPSLIQEGGRYYLVGTENGVGAKPGGLF